VKGITRGQRLVLGGVLVSFLAAAGTRSAPNLVGFAASLVALASVAWLVSFATEALGEHFGPAVTGSLQSALGNLPELFVTIFALSAGQTEIALTSLVGSILANALLVLGLVIVVGARESSDGIMHFSKRLPNDTATLLQVAVFAIVLVGLAVGSGDRAAHHITAISVVASICLLVVYTSWVIPYLRSDAGPGEGGERATPRLSLWAAIGLLAVAGVMALLVADWFIASLTPAIKTLGISKAFAGFVIVAIAGNAAENFAGIALASKGQADVAISVVKNSVSQIAAFLFPVLILISLLFTVHLTFALAPIFIGALALTAIAVWQITGDGEAAPFEGVALIALFVILATFTLYL